MFPLILLSEDYIVAIIFFFCPFSFKDFKLFTLFDMIILIISACISTIQKEGLDFRG